MRRRPPKRPQEATKAPLRLQEGPICPPLSLPRSRSEPIKYAVFRVFRDSAQSVPYEVLQGPAPAQGPLLAQFWDPFGSHWAPSGRHAVAGRGQKTPENTPSEPLWLEKGSKTPTRGPLGLGKGSLGLENDPLELEKGSLGLENAPLSSKKAPLSLPRFEKR